MEKLTGTVERIVFHNPDSGWCVLKVRAKGRRRLLTVVGHSLFIVPGETIEAEGEWTEHSEHGERLVTQSLKTMLPRQAHAAEKYLSSGLVKGIGPEFARRLVEKYGAEVFDVIETRPDLLLAVEGIGPSRARSIRESWHEQKAMRELMNFLGSHGISATKAPRIFRVFGADAVRIIQQNPYRLAREVSGIGFKTADLIARHSGTELDREERFASALHDRLQRAIARGHCAYPEDLLLHEACRELEGEIEDIESALMSEIESGRLTEEEIGPDERLCVAPAGLAAAERRLADELVTLGRGRPPWGPPIFLDAPPSPGAHESKQIRLSLKQREALRVILSSKVSVLTGGPGTGKTTLIQSVWRELNSRHWTVACCAPTGRASQRLTEATGVEAQTIHRLLGWAENGFIHDAGNPLRVDLLIVDEASMVGLELMEALVQAVPRNAALLLVGDADQLPSVQAGRVLESILESGVIPHAHLLEVFRQEGGGESLIIRAAHDVLEGRMPNLITQRPEQSFHFVEARGAEDAAEKIVRLVHDRIPNRFKLNPLDDVQVICPMNKGLIGARVVNRRLQEALNPSPSDRIDRYGTSLAVGDKVIVTANDYDKEIFNGDIGRVLQIERDRSSLRIDFGGRRVDFDFSELDILSLAFAITIHKSQGSEYEAVIIPVLEESTVMLNRNLLYTAITRGRRLVVLVGTKRALHLSLRANSGLNFEKRWSALAKRLVEARSRGFDRPTFSFDSAPEAR